MINVIISFKVKEEHVNQAIQVIKTFINKVNTLESGTLFYKSFQDSSDPAQFTHIMSFKNEEAQRIHRNSVYCKQFVEALYPLCSDKPKPYVQIEIH